MKSKRFSDLYLFLYDTPSKSNKWKINFDFGRFIITYICDVSFSIILRLQQRHNIIRSIELYVDDETVSSTLPSV